MLAESFDPRLSGSGKQLAISRLLNLLADDTKMDEPGEKHQESPMTGAFAEPTPGSSKRRSRTYTGFFKAAFEPCLFASLRDTRTPESRQDAIDSFSEKLRTALAQGSEEKFLPPAIAANAYLQSESKNRAA